MCLCKLLQVVEATSPVELANSDDVALLELPEKRSLYSVPRWIRRRHYCRFDPKLEPTHSGLYQRLMDHQNVIHASPLFVVVGCSECGAGQS